MNRIYLILAGVAGVHHARKHGIPGTPDLTEIREMGKEIWS
jgi:hypothetical protein